MKKIGLLLGTIAIVALASIVAFNALAAGSSKQEIADLFVFLESEPPK